MELVGTVATLGNGSARSDQSCNGSACWPFYDGLKFKV